MFPRHFVSRQRDSMSLLGLIYVAHTRTADRNLEGEKQHNDSTRQGLPCFRPCADQLYVHFLAPFFFLPSLLRADVDTTDGGGNPPLVSL